MTLKPVELEGVYAEGVRFYHDDETDCLLQRVALFEGGVEKVSLQVAPMEGSGGYTIGFERGRIVRCTDLRTMQPLPIDGRLVSLLQDDWQAGPLRELFFIDEYAKRNYMAFRELWATYPDKPA